MVKTRYLLPLLALTLASFLLVTRPSFPEKISSTLSADSFNTDHVLSILLFRELITNQGKQKATTVSLSSDNEPHMGGARKLCGYTWEAKEAALQNLEDVLLEPPRAASGRSQKYLKRTRYLPDLMGDSLESYPRRVFIDVGLPEKKGGSGTEWFRKNYPTRKQKFEMYTIETVWEEEIGMSDWLRKNVEEEEYVVMKAEADVVEEMMKSDSIALVDELFLECKPKRGRRPYWECLALYGKLRDEGVAVHQWWG